MIGAEALGAKCGAPAKRGARVSAMHRADTALVPAAIAPPHGPAAAAPSLALPAVHPSARTERLEREAPRSSDVSH